MAFDVRRKSDYDDFYIISKDDVLEQIKHATEFCSEVESYIDNKLGNISP